MDISTLTSLINTFRAETKQDSITPDSLGQLLQRIVNVLGQASDTSTVQQITQWKNTISSIGAVLTSLALASDDRNNIYLNVGSVNVATGAGMMGLFTIRQATTERAGAMRAQQVRDLNSVRNKINHVEQLELKVEATASSVLLALHDKYDDVFNDPSLLQKELPLASSSQAGVLSAADYKKFSQTSEATPATAHPFYHIECDSSEHRIRVKFPADVISDGYVPYVVRWTNKKSRYRNKLDHSKKWYGPRQRGWHLYGDGKRIKVTLAGLVTFGQNKGTQKNPVWEYGEQEDYLFDHIRKIVNAQGSFMGFKVGFGGKTYLVHKNRRFRFGIVFGPPLQPNQTLNFSMCVTNIAEFYVNLSVDKDSEGNDIYYLIYSI